MAKQCPIEGCEKKQIATRGEYGHWRRHHIKDIATYQEFKARFPGARVTSSGDGAKPPAAAVPPPTAAPPPALEAQTTPEEVFRVLGQHLGIKETTARSTAFYLTQTYDLNNAEHLWEGFKDCLYLTPIERRVWWKTWVARNHLPVEADTLDQVLQETQSRPQAKDASTATAGKLKTRYLVNESTGEMERIDPESESYEGGMTFTDARLRSRDIEQRKPKAGGLEPRYHVDDDTGQMHRVDPDSEDYAEAEPFWKARARSRDIQQHTLQTQQGAAQQFAVIGSRILPLKEGELGFNYAQASSEAQSNWEKEMERERQAVERERLERPPVPGSAEPSWIGTLITSLVGRDNGGGDRELTDSRMRELETRFTGQLELERERSRSAQENVVNAINSLKDTLANTKRDSPDPFDTFDRYLNIQQKMEARITGEPVDDASAWRRDRGLLIKTLREQFPDFIEAGKEIAEATKMQVQAQGQQRVMKACPRCGTVVRYPASAQEVQCPSCQTSIVPEVPVSPPSKQPTRQPEASDAEGDHANGNQKTVSSGDPEAARSSGL